MANDERIARALEKIAGQLSLIHGELRQFNKREDMKIGVIPNPPFTDPKPEIVVPLPGEEEQKRLAALDKEEPNG